MLELYLYGYEERKNLDSEAPSKCSKIYSMHDDGYTVHFKIMFPTMVRGHTGVPGEIIRCAMEIDPDSLNLLKNKKKKNIYLYA